MNTKYYISISLSLVLVTGYTTGSKVAAQNASKDKNVIDTSVRNKMKSERIKKVFKEEWPSIARHTKPEWFRDAKFGIYTCLAPATLATQCLGIVLWISIVIL